MKKILFIIILIGAGYFYLNPSYNEQNNPATNILNSIKSAISNNNMSSVTKDLLPDNDSNTTVYKYQDNDGQWHFSDSANSKIKNQTRENYSSNTNVINSIKPKPASAKSRPEEPKTPASEDISASPFTVYTQPGKIKQLIQDAKSIQQKLNNRKEFLDQQIETQ